MAAEPLIVPVDPEPVDGRWCGNCGGELTRWRRRRGIGALQGPPVPGEIETHLMCPWCFWHRLSLVEKHG